MAAVYVFISAQENYDWNMYKSLQTLALGELREKELSDERARDSKRTLSRLSVVTGGRRGASLRNTSGSAKCAGEQQPLCLFACLETGGRQEAAAPRWI